MGRKFEKAKPRNLAIETPDFVVSSYPKPMELDLFAYYRNRRVEHLAKADPSKIFWTVGLEFMSDGPLLLPNLYQINRDALDILSFIPDRSVDRIHILTTLTPNEYHLTLLTNCYQALVKGGELVTADFTDNRSSVRTLNKLGFQTLTTPFDDIDMLSDWVGRFHSQGTIKVTARK